MIKMVISAQYVEEIIVLTTIFTAKARRTQREKQLTLRPLRLFGDITFLVDAGAEFIRQCNGFSP